MSGTEVANLRQAAEQAFAAGQHQKALAHSIRLERADPDEPAWARYTAHVCRVMGRTMDQIDALDRAAERHARRGETLKAATACKHILALDPEHAGTRRRLAALRAQHEKKRPERRSSPPPPRGKITPGGWTADGERSGLKAVPLRRVVPGARRAEKAGIYAIPLEEEPEASLSLDVSGEFGPEHGTARLPSGAAVEQIARAPGEAPSTAAAPVDIELTAEDAAVMAVAAELRMAQRTEQALTDTPLFRDLPETAFYDLIDRARILTFAVEEPIFKQGAPGDALYVIASGEVGVIDEGPPRKGICKLGEGDFFGEMALLSDAPRSATCTALAEVELIAIDRDTIHGVLEGHPDTLTVLLRFFRDRSVDRVLQVSPVFSGLSRKDKDKIRPYFRFLEVEPDTVMIEEGSRPDGLIVFVAGKAEALGKDAVSGKPERLGLLLPGDLAGELSLLTNQTARATVRAIDKIFALEFPAGAFHKILQARPAVAEYVKKVARSRPTQRPAHSRY